MSKMDAMFWEGCSGFEQDEEKVYWNGTKED